ncbi:MAG: hypothetical protein QM691_09310 [Opitutaceae bacterium]
MSVQPSAPDFPPRTAEDWNDAYQRVESYLRAHRIVRPLAISELTKTIVAAAWKQSLFEPDEPPVTLALREADRVITDWFARVLAQHATHSRRLGARGRLALALADAPGRWPDAFLAPVPPPRELTAAMRAAFLRAGPPPHLFKMTPQAISLGPIAKLVDLGWRATRRSPTVRLLVQLPLLAGLGALLYFAFR